MEDPDNSFLIIPSYTPSTEKYTIYFIEMHLSSEDTTIEINLDKSDSSLGNLFKIDMRTKYYGKDVYLVNIYKCSFNPSLLDKKKIKYSNETKTCEIKITLTQKKCIFDSINTINIEKDNFLGVLKFSDYKWYLGMKYKPPTKIELSNNQIFQYFLNALIEKDNKNKKDLCFIKLINYGINLLKKIFLNNYDYELFILVYINSFYTEIGELVKQTLDLFEIDKDYITIDSSFMVYLEELEKIYQNHYDLLEKMEMKSEKYSIRFYTVYIYFLSELKQNEKLLSILYELMNNNKYDNLILPKLYLSKFFKFYKTLEIPEDIKAILQNSFIISSKTYNDLLNSFSLISEFTKKNFVNILTSVKNNYEKIHEICSKEKNSISIDDYYTQNNKDINELKTIKECLDFILTNKKKYEYETIQIGIDTYLYFIKNHYEQEFLYYLENKLFEYFLKYEDLENAISFSSQLRRRQFIPLLEYIKKNIEKISEICLKFNEKINIEKYVQKFPSDELTKIMELIQYIIQFEKNSSKKFIKFNINIWEDYTHTKNIDDLFIIRKIIFLCSEIEPQLNENSIDLGEKIHNLGLELIRKGQLKGEKLNQFLGENEIFYTDNKIKKLEKENDKMKDKIENMEQKVSNIQYDVSKLKTEVNSLSNSNEKILGKINSIESNIRKIKDDIYELKHPPVEHNDYSHNYYNQ